MKWILLFSLLYVPAVYSQSYWQVKNHNASITTQYSDKSFKYAVLNINWDATIGCRPTIGLVLMKGNSLGTFKAAKESSENMVIHVGDERWSEKTIIASYTGGTEAMFVGTEALIEAVKKGDVLRVRLFQKSPLFEFVIDGAAAAFAKAKDNCK